MKTLETLSLGLGVCLSVALGSNAIAQLRPETQLGSKIPVAPTKADPVVAGLVRDGYVRCVYSGPYRGKIDTLLLNSDPLTLDLDAAKFDLPKFLRSDDLRSCFTADATQSRVSISFSENNLRYIMLESAYLINMPKMLPNADQLDRVERKFNAEPGSLEQAKAIAEFSDCIVNEDPVGADHLVRTDSNSDAEWKAASAMTPALSACLIAGQTMELKPANIRSFAADGLWQRFVAPQLTRGRN